MNERDEEIAILVIRMEKLLGNIIFNIERAVENSDTRHSPLLQKIIALFERFKISVVSRMKRTPEMERMRVINLEASKAKTAEISSELEGLQRVSEKQDSDFDIFLRDILTRINDEEEIMRSIRRTSEVDIPKETENSVQEMLDRREQQKARREQLQTEINTAERKLREFIEINATTERKLSEMCATVEREYRDLLAEYDRDIGASHALTERLSKDYDSLQAETKDMQDRLATQRVLYTRFKEEREAALTRAFNEKVELFKQTRAAKVIQRAWRVYYERVTLRRRRRAKKKQ